MGSMRNARFNSNHSTKFVAKFSCIRYISFFLILSVASFCFAFPPKKDKKPPKAEIVEPFNGSIVSKPVKVVVKAKDNKGIRKVTFTVDGKIVSEDSTEPYEYYWYVSFWADGNTHTVKAIARDLAGNFTKAEPVTVTIPKVVKEAPVLISPKMNLLIKNRSQIPLKWKAQPGANNYAVAIASDKDFTNIVVSYVLPDTALITDRLERGKYYWQVIGQNPVGLWGDLSKVRTFRIEGPKPPDLSGPEVNFHFKSSDIPLLTWHPSKHASAYDVKVVLEYNPDVIEFTQTVFDTFLEVRGLEENWHLWSVRSKNPGDVYGDWSDSQRFRTYNPEIVNFAFVPAGDYTFGEHAQLQTINYDFEIMEFPVTCKQYVQFLNQLYSRKAVDPNGYGFYMGDKYHARGNYKYVEVNTKKVEFGDIIFDHEKDCFAVEDNEFLDHPVADVSWFGARAFAMWYGLHLPSEFEWEKAARGNTGFNFPWGNDITCKNANAAGCNPYGYTYATTPVGYFNGNNNTVDSPSPYGVYDMCGNVWEWVSSWYGGKFPSSRVTKGGSYYETKGTRADRQRLSSWSRFAVDPNKCSGLYDSAIGFRCIRK